MDISSTATVSGTVYWSYRHITFRDCRVHSFSDLSRDSCKWIPKATELKRIPTHKECKCEEFCVQARLNWWWNLLVQRIKVKNHLNGSFKNFIYSFPNLNSWNSALYRVYLKGLCMPNSTLTLYRSFLSSCCLAITQLACVVWLSTKTMAQKDQVLPDIICILNEHL